MVRRGNADGVDEPDVEIGASVKAKKLRFRSKPKTRVDFHGEVGEPGRRSDIETASDGERDNLPEEVEPGVTYRDVRVRWSAEARIDDPANQSGVGKHHGKTEGEKHEEQDEG